MKKIIATSFSRTRGNAWNAMFTVVLAMFLFAQDARAASRSYFNMAEDYSSDIVPFPKWTGMMSRFDDQKKIPDDDCGTIRFHPCAIKEWKVLVEGLRDQSLTQQLARINDWGNAHPYIVDQMNWGMDDFWDTPYEFMEINGDCEDYAIAKYYSLRGAGIPADRLRVIVVQDFNLGGIIHAVLGVYDRSRNLYVLDNQIKQVMPALRIYHYKPIYGINEDGWWAYHPKS